MRIVFFKFYKNLIFMVFLNSSYLFATKKKVSPRNQLQNNFVADTELRTNLLLSNSFSLRTSNNVN